MIQNLYSFSSSFSGGYMTRKVFAGVDVGTSLAKLVIGPTREERVFEWQHPNLADIRHKLRIEGVTNISVTGSGATKFLDFVSQDPRGVIIQENGANLFKVEQAVQMKGVKILLNEQGLPHESFLLVSIGTATSFVLVDGEKFTVYEPGLSVGGRTVERLAAMHGIAPYDIGVYALGGTDKDVLMKEVYDDLPYPQSEYVLASMGRLHQTRVNAQDMRDLCLGLLKMIATLTIGHLLTIKQNPDWNRWNGQIVFIGTPVHMYQPLRLWLQMMSPACGFTAHFPENGQFAGAIGAWHRAATM